MDAKAETISRRRVVSPTLTVGQVWERRDADGMTRQFRITGIRGDTILTAALATGRRGVCRRHSFRLANYRQVIEEEQAVEGAGDVG
ncbi:MAG: hypothetical protein Q8S13_09335 [Dehalococcoidia bacterium]|nr:hypothetical protein [Dehalococcoidia bacterium]